MGWNTCVNPFDNHGKSMLFNTRTISTIRNQYDRLNELPLRDIEIEFMDVDRMSPEGGVLSQQSEGSIATEDALFDLDACLRSLHIPPIETGLSNTQRSAELDAAVDRCKWLHRMSRL